MLTGLKSGVRELDLGELAARRWFAGKGRRAVGSSLVDALEVPGSEEAALVLLDVTYEDGPSERYVVPGRIVAGAVVEVEPQDSLWPALARFVAGGRRAGSFEAVPGAFQGRIANSGRALTDDQSNTSIVLGDALVVKCYRRLRPGTHPELELLQGLSRAGSRRAPRFAGSLARHSSDGEEALVCVYTFASGEPVGWESLIVRLTDALVASDPDALAGLTGEMGSLGSAAAELHVDLARAFGIEIASRDVAPLACERARTQLDEARAVATGDLARALEASAPRLSAALDDLRLLESQPATRVHGDLHVGQFVAGPDGLVVVDFEGEPGRSLDDRRRTETPLRDLACLLLSFDHVAVAVARRLSFGPALETALEWSAGARLEATEAYRAGIAGSGLAYDERLLRALEVEKECREAIYAATVLPEWSYAPALVLPRLAGAD